MRAVIVRLLLMMLAYAGGAVARGADAQRFEVVKGIYYYQVEPGKALLQTNNCYRFSVQVHATLPGDLITGAITTPRQRIDLLPDLDGDPIRFRDRFDPDDRFAFENFYPNGTYQLYIRGRNDGDRTMTFSLTGDAYPPAPVLNNFTEAQNLPFNQYNEISWQPFVGGGITDFIQVQIETVTGNNVWETPDFGEEGALTGLDTRAIIPAGILNAGRSYVGTIRFNRVQSSGSRQYPGVPGVAGYFSRTEFPVRAVSTGLDPAINRVQLWRTARFQQETNLPPLPEREQWEFVASVDAVTNTVSSVGLTLPGSPTNVTRMVSTTGQFEYKHEMEATQSTFLGFYPNGRYGFEVVRRDARIEGFAVDLGSGSFPPPPKIHAVPTYANHAPGTPLVVSWDAWAGATDPDFIRVELFDENGKVWDTSNFSSEKHLRPHVTSVIIPGMYFVPGHDYQVEVHFHRVTVLGARIVPGALVFGGFSTRTQVNFGTPDPDVVGFRVAHGQHLWQRGPNAGNVELDAAPFRFEATAAGARTDSLLTAQVTFPNGHVILLPQDPVDFRFRLSDTQSTGGALLARYPAGIYEFRFGTQNDGARTSVVQSIGTQFPPIPRVRNFATLAEIAEEDPYDVIWDPWPAVNPETDHVRFTIRTLTGGLVLDSDGIDSDVIPAETNRFTIKKDTLRANTTYVARLRFERNDLSENSTYPGARGTASTYSEIAFHISTYARIRIGTASLMAPDQVRFSIAGLVSGRRYALMMTTDFKTWTHVKTVTITSSTTTQSFTTPTTGERAFYRWELVL